MIERHRPLSRCLTLSVCVGLVCAFAVSRAAETAHSPAQHETAAEEKPSGSPAGHTANAAQEAKPSPAKSAGGYPAEVQGMLKLGASLTDRGEYESAEIAFRQVMAWPEGPVPAVQDAVLGLARMYRRQGSLTKAAAIYEKFLKEYPGSNRSPDVLLDLGRTHRAMGAHKLAINRFYSVINSTLKLPAEGFEHYQLLAKTAQYEIAETHFLAGEFAEAGKFFARLRLLDLAPADRASAHFKSGHALHLQGEIVGAVATLRAYLEQWPDDENVPQARYLLATSLRSLNRQQEAFAVTLDLLRAAKSNDTSDAKRWVYWQRRTGNQLANDFFESGETLNAQAIYRSMVELSSEPAWRLPLTYQIGLCQERLGNADLARASYQTIIDSAGETPTAEVKEVARMASWRIGHLDWREKIGQQVTAFFETTTGRPSLLPSPAKTEP
ncbi:MAG: tetratricopeptide repeat protein [Opitutaceae bacterium]